MFSKIIMYLEMQIDKCQLELSIDVLSEYIEAYHKYCIYIQQTTLLFLKSRLAMSKGL